MFDVVADKPKGSWADFESAEAILDVILGFMNATQVTFGENRTECQFAAESLLYSAERGYRIMTARWFNWFDFWFAMDSFIFIPYELYSLQFSCTMSYYELIDLAEHYLAIFENLDLLFFNLFYSGGSILKGGVNIVMYFVAKDYTRVQNAFTFGMELGQIFWMIFYPVHVYLDEVLNQGGLWGQDYTWDAVINIDPDGASVPVIGTSGVP